MSTADLPDATEPEAVASAILDGEASAAELARADEPAVAAALAAFRPVADGVGADTGTADELGRERAISAALAAWGTEAEGAAPGDELARRRQARRGLGLVGVAAAVLAALAIGGLALRDDEPTDTAASAPGAAGEAELEAGAAGATSGSGGPAAGGTVLATLHLGAFDDVDALVAAAVGDAAAREAANDDDAFDEGSGQSTGAGAVSEDQAAEEGSDSAGAPAPASGAAACLLPGPPAGAPRTTSTATLDGRPVVVVVVGSGDDTVVQVTDAQTCEVRYEGPAG